MSILNVACTPNRVLIAVDSVGGDARDDSPVEATKILHAPVSNVVLAARGVAGLLHGVFRGVIEHPASFDVYAAGMAEICDIAVGAMDAQMKSIGLSRPLIAVNLELVLAGWSDESGAMRASCFRKGEGTMAFTRHPVDPWLLMPGEPWGGEALPAPPNTPDKMFAYSRRQVAWWQQTLPRFPAGGRIVLAELTRRSVTISSRPV